jgi:hypothetical protein
MTLGTCHTFGRCPRHFTTNNTDFAPGKNGNLSGGKHINFPEAFLQNDSGVKIRLK